MYTDRSEFFFGILIGIGVIGVVVISTYVTKRQYTNVDLFEDDVCSVTYIMNDDSKTVITNPKCKVVVPIGFVVITTEGASILIKGEPKEIRVTRNEL